MDIRALRASIWGERVAAVLGSLLVVIALWLWALKTRNDRSVRRRGGRPLPMGARRSAIAITR
jgi:cytochrome bd-type quinol oxidase subunit 1